ncbi:hypothetical protein NOX78_09975 [Enterobacter kobei]|uniref:hypothetical protein n=1 Tax=Enterobacter kobei TaxID=208224 RepID=UPI002108BF4B|nr:hypothetical protein [Enterobacter kobei]MCQ4418499.1 hypothetical protein [Enterobacter kobei]HDC4269795.1 hypothetical protein [Enterobacter kobei]
MSTITQEWLRSQISAIKAVGITDSNTLQAFEIALASLEAEPVGYFGRFDADDEDLIDQCSPNIIGAFPLYAAPPAPANAEPVAWLWSHRKHPSEVTLVRPEDDEKAEGAHWSGWSCQALYAEPPAPVSVADEGLLHMAASAIDDLLSNKDRSGAGVWVDIPAKLRRAAMLQGADGNSPVIPDGYALVPVEPTKEMIEAGWSYYMTSKAPGSSGVYSAMLAAAPQQEVK